MTIQQLARILGIETMVDNYSSPDSAPMSPSNTELSSIVSKSVVVLPTSPSSSVKSATWLYQELATIADTLCLQDSSKLDALSLYICTVALCRQQLDRGQYSESSVVRRILLHIMNCLVVKIGSLLASVSDFTCLPSPAAALQGYLDRYDAHPTPRADSDMEAKRKRRVHAVMRKMLEARGLG